MESNDGAVKSEAQGKEKQVGGAKESDRDVSMSRVVVGLYGVVTNKARLRGPVRWWLG